MPRVAKQQPGAPIRLELIPAGIIPDLEAYFAANPPMAKVSAAELLAASQEAPGSKVIQFVTSARDYSLHGDPLRVAVAVEDGEAQLLVCSSRTRRNA